MAKRKFTKSELREILNEWQTEGSQTMEKIDLFQEKTNKAVKAKRFKTAQNWNNKRNVAIRKLARIDKNMKIIRRKLKTRR